jgi:hypothetical protein
MLSDVDPKPAIPTERTELIAALKRQWSNVLMCLESIDRVAWMVWFDARLADFDGRTLTVDFSDPQRLDPTQQYPIASPERHRAALESAILSVTKMPIRVEVRPWQP